jgi:hypothetical protein
MRRLWIGLGVLLGLLLVLVLAGYIVLRSIDWNRYKEPIAQIVYESTGRRLDLSGDVSVAIGLRPGIALSGASLENAAWSDEPEMVTLDRLVVQLRVLPLLRGEVDIASLELSGLDVLLETNADGEANWSFEPPPSETPPEPEEQVEEAGLDVDVERLGLRDARIRIVDRGAGTERTIDIDRLLATPNLGLGRVDVELVANANGQPVRIVGESTGVVFAPEGAQHDINLRLTTGDAEADLKGSFDRSVEPTTLDLALEIQGERLADWRALAGPGVPALGAHRLSARIAGTASDVAIRDLQLTIGESTLSGDVDLALGGDRPRLDAKLRAPRIDLADLQEPAEVAATPDPAKQETPSQRLLSDAPLPLDALTLVDAKIALSIDRLRAGEMDFDDVKVALELADAKLRVDPLSLRLAGGVVKTKLDVDASRNPPRVALQGSADELVTAQLLRESDLIDGGPMSLTVDVKGRGRSVAALASTLDGRVGLDVTGTRIKSAAAGIAFADLQEMVLGRKDVRSLVVDCAAADFVFQKGIGRPEVLVFNLDSVALFGRGAIDLGEETFALRFDREAKGVSASRALPPFTVAGTFTDPKTGVDATRLAGRVLDLGAEVLTGDVILDWEKWPKECRALAAAYDRKRTEPSEAGKLVRKGGEEAVKALGSLLRREGFGTAKSKPAAGEDAKVPQDAPEAATPAPE